MAKISEIEPKKGFDMVEGKVLSVSEPRQVRDGQLTIAEAELKDDSGTIALTLWNDDASKVNIGDVVRITKGWANEFQGKVSISAGKFGQMDIVSKGTGSSEEISEDAKSAAEEDII
ncbi:MAG: OB-fold nucleic acid binding domain-containing protein [bacterium]